MARLTRVKDRYECRVDTCFAESWMCDVYGHYPLFESTENVCDHCPFMSYINKLADYEDKELEACRKAVRHVLAIADIYEGTKEEYMRAAIHSLKNTFDHDFIEQAVDELLFKKGEDVE